MQATRSPLFIATVPLRLSAAALARAGTLLASVLIGAPASAQLSDTIHPYVSLGYSYDDNLFRLPDGASPPGGERADRFRQAAAGVQLERPVGRQVFVVDARVSRVTFQNFSDLDYNGKDFSGIWNWQVGNHLSGQLGATYAEALTPFKDYHTTERNLKTQRGEFFEGKWRFHPSWQVRTRLNSDKYDYELLSRQYLNRTHDGAELGFDYLSTTGSTIGLQARREKVRYPQRQLIGGSLFDESFSQNSASLVVFWKINPLSDLRLVIGHAKREHATVSVTDSSGANGQLSAHWSPLASVNLTATLSKKFEPYEGGLVSYSDNRGGTLKASWTPLTKVRVDAQYLRETRDFQGVQSAAGLLRGAKDNTRTTSLALNYQVRRNIGLNLSVLQDKRRTNTLFSSSYRAKSASLTADVQF
jgi:exopolysaccharide biosynthesis operon protein EpsL